MALATFERTITQNNTPYDRWLKGDKNAMSKDAVAGLAIFQGKGKCITCHAGPNFTLAMTKSGIPYKNTGVYQSPVLDPDPGRYGIDKTNPENDGAFRIPSLRGVGKTEPYMHNGDIATLEEVVEFYDRGGDKGKLKKLGLTAVEKKQLVEFLRNGITEQDE
jgi:cytochrome c peroxidase